MLTLKRKSSESILIRIPGRDKPVVVTVVTSMPSSAKLAFEAEDDIIILREELDGNPAYSVRPAG